MWARIGENLETKKEKKGVLSARYELCARSGRRTNPAPQNGSKIDGLVWLNQIRPS